MGKNGGGKSDDCGGGFKRSETWGVVRKKLPKEKPVKGGTSSSKREGCLNCENVTKRLNGRASRKNRSRHGQRAPPGIGGKRQAWGEEGRGHEIYSLKRRS